MTTAPDPRTPVIVGVAQAVRRPGEDGAELTDPGAMMAAVAREAAADSGAGDALLRRVGVVAALPAIVWPHGNPSARVVELLGIEAATMRSSMFGGNGPQLLVNLLAGRIQRGELDAALICGAEAMRSVVYAQSAGEPLDWPPIDAGAEPGEVAEADRAANTDAELAARIGAPAVAYPLIENAIRAANGRTADEQLDTIARLWSGFSAVAAEHPHAWQPRAYSPEELRTVSGANRIVSFPYRKLMNANLQVDQAAALAICSAEAARAAGIDPQRWVFVHAGADAADHWFLTEREELHRSPAIAACGRELFALAGCGPGDLAHVDLYSCFPAAVQLAAAELGLALDDPARPLTVTGGLTFFGGPGNDYATHAIATVVERLRAGERGERALATALGWYATKHSLGIYGNEPPPNGFRHARPQAEVDAGPSREVAPAHDGTATVETLTVTYDRGGAPDHGVVLGLLADGRRAIAQTGDPDTLAAMTSDGLAGAEVALRADGSFSLLP